MAYRNQLLSEGKTIYHVFEVSTNKKIASFLNENYAHNCAANRSFNNLIVVVEEYPSGHTQSDVYLDGEVLNEINVSTNPLGRSPGVLRSPLPRIPKIPSIPVEKIADYFKRIGIV